MTDGPYRNVSLLSHAGVIYTIPSFTWQRDQLPKDFPPPCEGPAAIAHRWHATVSHSLLTLVPAYEGTGPGVPALPPQVQYHTCGWLKVACLTVSRSFDVSCAQLCRLGQALLKACFVFASCNLHVLAYPACLDARLLTQMNLPQCFACTTSHAALQVVVDLEGCDVAIVREALGKKSPWFPKAPLEVTTLTPPATAAADLGPDEGHQQGLGVAQGGRPLLYGAPNFFFFVERGERGLYVYMASVQPRLSRI